ncbi:alanine:cation symporter family protein [Cytobacillus depressus]|uniref:Alanine:cation symporter family protein n=1 Tax=Cytobacillus depressus TaxID=1602942 RepID=A0A6L3VEI6_9BACI|nr:alanine/glycine:cation symporter family protein [Cytobacillus depressus]KAB2337591.1 alanine:cation symporter family protein [Cytobacillus depressus]
MEDFINSINGVLWATPVIYILLGVGLLFSILTRFLQVRHFPEMIRLMFDGKSSEAGVSSFQALSMSLGGRVGTGNIAGVATAIAFGGPGAVFWMCAIAFLGASSAFIESTLSQIYKVKINGEYRGGPSFYIEKGIGWRWFAVLFAFASMLGMALLSGTQSNTTVVAIKNAFGMNHYLSGAIYVGIFGLIIFGGVKRIAGFAQIIVPFMAIGYILMALVMMVLNISEVPAVITLIFRSAFGLEPAFGGIVGMAVMWGVKRGIFSNEAGQGSGAHPSAAAEVSHPAKQGFVQAFSVYIDTLLVCAATAFMILTTGMYNTQATDGSYIVNNIGEVEVGPAYTQIAIDSVIPGFGAGFVAVALLFFTFTTLVAYYYIAETNLVYLTRGKDMKWAYHLLRFIMIAIAYYGVVKSAALAWALGDVGVGIMVWINVIAILILAKPALIALKDYERQKKLGLDPTFDPVALGIKNADYWEEKIKKEKELAS